MPLSEDSEAALLFRGCLLVWLLVGLFLLLASLFLVFLAGLAFFLAGLLDAAEDAESLSDESLSFLAGGAFLPQREFQAEIPEGPALGFAEEGAFFCLLVFFLGVLLRGDSDEDDRLGLLTFLAGVLERALLLATLSEEEESPDSVVESPPFVVLLFFLPPDLLFCSVSSILGNTQSWLFSARTLVFFCAGFLFLAAARCFLATFRGFLALDLLTAPEEDSSVEDSLIEVAELVSVLLAEVVDMEDLLFLTTSLGSSQSLPLLSS